MSDITRRALLRRAAAASCAPLAAGVVQGCARRIDPARSLAVGAPVDGDVTLTAAQAPELSRAGGAVLMHPSGQGSFLVVNGGSGVFALRAECPHEGCLLTWVPEDRQAECPCHGSRFASDGTVLNPPAN